MDSGNLVHFSNSIFAGYLKVIERYQSPTRLQSFIRELKCEESWLRDASQWHDADFLERFYLAIIKHFPEIPGIPMEGALALYTDNQLQRFTSFAGLLLSPRMVFSRLSRSSGRMNTYNEYSFEMVSERVAFSRGRLTQRYLEPGRKFLNACLCDAARGSVTGIMSYLGHHLLEIHEPRCVKRGDAECEYELTWVNRLRFGRTAAWIALTFAGYLLQKGLAGQETLHRALFAILFSSLGIAVYSLFKHRASLVEAFEYQESTLDEARRAASANELMNRRLIEFQRELNDAIALASIGEASFSMVHDMASPTTLIRLYSEQLSRTIQGKYPDDSEFLRYCNAIDRATQSLVKLQILFRSRANDQESNAVVGLDLRQVTADFIDLVSPLLQNHSIQAKLDGSFQPSDRRAVRRKHRIDRVEPDPERGERPLADSQRRAHRDDRGLGRDGAT